MVAIAITTAPRPRETFTASIASMRRAGFTQDVWVLSDSGPDTVLEDNAHTIINNPPMGGLKNWAKALQTLVHESTDPWVMVVEDDVVWAPRAAAKLDQDLKLLRGKKVGYLSLYIARKVSRAIENAKGVRRLDPGLHRTDLGEGVWGSQAYCMPRATAEALLQDAYFDDMRRNYAKNRNRDGIVSGALERMGLPLFYRVPALVNHWPGQANSSLRNKPIQPALLCDYWSEA